MMNDYGRILEREKKITSPAWIMVYPVLLQLQRPKQLLLTIYKPFE
jgi:hypothetical protein